MKESTRQKLERAVLQIKKMIDEGHSFMYAKHISSRENSVTGKEKLLFQKIAGYREIKKEYIIKRSYQKSYIK